MHTFKKALAIVAAGAACLSMAACGGNSSDSKSGEGNLTVFWWGNQQRNERTAKINDMFMQENPDIKVTGQFAEFADYWQKLSTNAAGKTMPDIIQMDVSYISQYIDNGQLLDLKLYIDNGSLDVSDVDPNILKAGESDGKIYALTAATNVPVIIYDKTLLDEAGITMPEQPTIEEFEDVARQVYEKTGTKTNFRYYEGYQLPEYMLRAEGKTLMEKGKLGVDSASDLQPYFDVYEKGIKEGWHMSPETFSEVKIGSVEQDPLVYGTAPERMSWCTFRYSSQFSAYTKLAKDGHELAMATWPSTDVKKSNYIRTSMYWAISATSKNKDQAVKWLNWYTNNVDAAKVMLTDRGLPISTKVLDAIKSDLPDADQKALDFQQNVVTPNSSPANPPVPVGASELNTKIYPTATEDLCYGKIDAAAAAQTVFDQGNASLAKAAK